MKILKNRFKKGLVTINSSCFKTISAGALEPAFCNRFVNRDERGGDSFDAKIAANGSSICKVFAEKNVPNLLTNSKSYCEIRVEGPGNELKQLIMKKFSRSLHIREVDTGSCFGCESEIIAATNPIYDIQRFGIDFVASPRHADALLVTGPLSKNMEIALKKTYDAMPGPKMVITLGDCALDGGVFKGSYYTLGGINKTLPVLLHIPGCPPKPVEIITALLSYMKAGKLDRQNL